MGLVGNIKGSAGSTGATGAPGAAGTQWFIQTVNPVSPGDDGIGANNDLWLNTTTGDLFKKSAGTWV
jgi:hypothetical protein